jgi:hypothetical protein
LLQELALEIVGAEAIIAQAKSLELKFCLARETPQNLELRTFLSKLMHLPEVDVPGGPRGAIGSRIQTMFSDAQKVCDCLFKFHFHNSLLLEDVDKRVGISEAGTVFILGSERYSYPLRQMLG